GVVVVVWSVDASIGGRIQDLWAERVVCGHDPVCVGYALRRAIALTGVDERLRGPEGGARPSCPRSPVFGSHHLHRPLGEPPQVSHRVTVDVLTFNLARSRHPFIARTRSQHSRLLATGRS